MRSRYAGDLQECRCQVDNKHMTTTRTEKRLAEIQGQIRHLLACHPHDRFSLPIRYPALVKLETVLVDKIAKAALAAAAA